MSVAAHYVLDCCRGGGSYWKMSRVLFNQIVSKCEFYLTFGATKETEAINRSSERSECYLATTCRVPCAVSRAGRRETWKAESPAFNA